MNAAATLLNIADAPVNLYRSVFEVGGVSVRIAAERAADVALGPSLQAFGSEVSWCDVDIRVDWTEELFSKQERPLFDSGSVWRLYQCEQGFQFDFSSSSFGQRPYKRFVIDRRFRSAVLQMSKKSFARCCRSADPLDYPLDELLIMHRLTQESAIELHGCGVVSADGTGNLFVGHSGAGKSTTTRLWTEREDVEILSDDRIIVRRDWVPAAANTIRMYGTPWHGEACHASPGNAPLARIFVLEHGKGNVLTLLSPAQAVAELFARSFVPFHRHEYVDSALQFLQTVVDVVPCYRYAFEPNQAAVERILEFRD